jgi:hypothetical protein
MTYAEASVDLTVSPLTNPRCARPSLHQKGMHVDKTVTSLVDLQKIAESYSDRVFVFRGQSRSEWGLVPSLYRGIEPSQLDDLVADIVYHERDLHREFNDKSLPYINKPLGPWESMILAQHHGGPTRLLDWTTNLMNAAYFAASSSPESDGVIWCALPAALPVPPQLGRLHYEKAHRLAAIRNYIHDADIFFLLDVSTSVSLPPDDNNTSSVSNPPVSSSNPPTTAPFNQSDSPDHEGILVFLLSPHTNDRIRAQAGLFSVYISYSDGDIVMDHAAYLDIVAAKWGVDILHRLLIPAKAKPQLLSSLERNGVDASALFPDLQGLSTYLQGKHAERIQYFRSLGGQS